VITPSQEYRRTDFRHPEPLPKGLDAAVHRTLGSFHRRGAILGSLRRQADRVEELAREFGPLSDHQLQERLLGFRDRFRRSARDVEDCVPAALAAIREAAERKTGLRPFHVQLIGALALHRGSLAEMGTGEGKTLTASLAAILWGWTRRPCHVVTVNDYLVQRDAEWFGPLYRFCGVRVGHVIGAMNPEERRHNYDCDVTYATSKEVVADFLRDCLHLAAVRDPTRRLIRQLLQRAAAASGVVMRGLHSAIIDEADSVLIDEAVTPLIISSMQKNDVLREAVETAQQIIEPLVPGEDYRVDLRHREVELTETGRTRLTDRCARLPGLWRGPLRRFELVRQALVAREFFHPGRQYIIDDGRVVIVDEFTGRQMPNRTWRAGLHQAIEAKEQLPVTDPTDTLARLSFQRYFRQYYRLAGMTGTAREAAGEFWHIYRLPVVSIPPNRPSRLAHLPDRVFANEEAKWNAVLGEIERLHATRRPVLVGTRSVHNSEYLADRLADRGIDCHVLNAVRHQAEAAVVASAGDEGRITIATNMAGRGTDIKLGKGVADLGGLHVLATERHESGRVDRQLFGRAARQGNPGSAQAFVCLEDELLRRYLPRRVYQVAARLPVGHGGPGVTAARAAFALAQRNAQRAAFKMRQAVLSTDDWLDESLSFAGSEVG
jgi:preprotein translocase subunit SecA